MSRKPKPEPTLAELEAQDAADRYRNGRADTFDHGAPLSVLWYWDKKEPNDAELRAIVRSLLRRATYP